MGTRTVLWSIVITVTIVPNKASSNEIFATIIKSSPSLINISCGLSSVIKIMSAIKSR